VVRLSDGLRPTSTVGTPPEASASAAMRPAGPPPTTIASALSGINSLSPKILY
jgi:hypothetical protein